MCADCQVDSWILNAQGYPGQTLVTVPIKIDKADGLTGIDMVIHFDPNFMLVMEINSGPLLQEFISQSSIMQEEGKIYFSAAHSLSLTMGKGTIAEILLDVKESAPVGEVTPIIYETLRVYNEELLPCSTNSENGRLLITETGFRGDVYLDKAINSADVSLALKIAVGLHTPTPYQEQAADVNGDEIINSADSILILRAVVNMKTIFCLEPIQASPGSTVKIFGCNFGEEQNNFGVSLGGFWIDPISWSNHEIEIIIPSEIQPSSSSLALVNEENEISSNSCQLNLINFQQKLKSMSTTLFKSGERIVKVPDETMAAPCEQVTIPIEINDTNDIAGMDLVLTYDPNILSLIKAERTPLTEEFFLMTADAKKGEIIVALACVSGLTAGQGNLVNLIFEVLPDTQESVSTDLNIQELSLYNENALPLQGVIFLGGKIAINGEGNCSFPVDNKKSSKILPYQPTYFSYYNKALFFLYPYNLLFSPWHAYFYLDSYYNYRFPYLPFLFPRQPANENWGGFYPYISSL